MLNMYYYIKLKWCSLNQKQTTIYADYQCRVFYIEVKLAITSEIPFLNE